MAITDFFPRALAQIDGVPYVPNGTPPIPAGVNTPNPEPTVPGTPPPLNTPTPSPLATPTPEAAPSNFPNEAPAEFGSKTLDTVGRVEPPSMLPSATEYSLPDAIATGATVLTEIAAGLAVCFLIWGAIVFAMAAGDEEKIDHAKAIMKWSVFGLIIAITALGMVALVQNAIGTTGNA